MTADHAFDTPDYAAISAALAGAQQPPDEAEQPNPLFFNPDGTFKSPELAALHATQVQCGFSTPAREARRMLRDPRTAAMARAWLEERGLSLDGDDEPAQPPAAVTPEEAATAQVMEPLPAPPRVIDLDQLPDAAVVTAWYAAISGWDEEIAELQAKRARAVEIIQAAMGDADEARIGGRPVITWRTSKPTMRLDRKALEAHFGTAVIARFLKPAKPARPFKILGGDA